MRKFSSIIFAFFTTFLLFAEKPIVRDIQAIAGKGRKINVIWTLPEQSEKEITGLLIYRDTRQITSYSQIKNTNPIAQVEPNFTGYTDTVKDFNDYFYCVLALTKGSSKPYDLVMLSFNSTIKGVHLSANLQQKEPQKQEEEKLYYNGTLRETPLPYIDIETDSKKTNSEKTSSANSNEKNQKKISDNTASIASSLITKKEKKQPLLKPYIFEEDLISPDGGDDYLLFEILKDFFVQKKYKDTITQLNKLAGTNIKETTRNRIYFYIGQSQYLMGNYEDAVRTFVKVQRIYPVLTKKWIDSALDRI